MPTPTPASTITVAGYVAIWFPRQRPPFVRPAQQRDYERDIRRCILPAWIEDETGQRQFGDLLLVEVAPQHLLQLRERLVARRLALKTVRNIMDASLRAMLRDARTVDLLMTTDPFLALTWPRVVAPPPDPFTETERNALLDWFQDHRRHYYPFVAVLFHTGLRPSEAVALRWSDINIVRGTISIMRSRFLGAEGATKTPKSQRTIKVRPEVLALLRDLKPLHVGSDDYVFSNARNGGPINQSEWPKDHWNAAPRATGIRPQKFYCTRHSFISIALTRGANIKWLAEYCGTSVAMIERSYGRFLAESGDAQLDLLGDDRDAAQHHQGNGDRTRKTRDPGGRVSGSRRKTQAGYSVPDGI